MTALRANFCWIAFLTMLALSAAALAAQTIDVNRNNKTIAITTSDEATAPADIAAITIGFDLFAPDSDSASREGGDRSQAILAALHKAGIADKEIESDQQSLERNNNFNDKDTPAARAQRQFVFTQSWTVTTSPAAAGALIQLAIAAGANHSGNIDWRLSDSASLQARAAAAALVKARKMATQMAAGLGVQLGPLVYASNQAAAIRRSFVGMLKAGDIAMGSVLPQPAQPLAIRPRTLREEATIYAVFAID